MMQKKAKGTLLKVFRGKEGKLNHIIMQTLCRKNQPLAKYDIVRELKNTRGFSRQDAKTVYRRVDALAEQGWILEKGTRPAKPGWPTELYEITLGGKAALKVHKKDMDKFLLTASKEKLEKFDDSLE